MMRILGLSAVLTTAAILLPSLVQAQSLGEAAAREKEKKRAKSAKVYTDDDLRKAGGGNSSYTAMTNDSAAPAADASKPAAPGAKPEGKEKTPDEQKADKQAEWRKKLDKATADASQLSRIVDELQAAASDPSSMYAPGRSQTLSQLEDAKNRLAALNQQIADLNEEGRRNGFR